MKTSFSLLLFAAAAVNAQVSSAPPRPSTTVAAPSARPTATGIVPNPAFRYKNCRTTRIRKEIRDLTDAERTAYLDAVRRVSSDPRFTRLVQAHLDNQYVAHNHPAFLPWHRVYLREYEDLLQEILGPTFALPYWDWSLDSQRPHQSILWTEDYFGASDPTGSGRIINGPFVDMTISIPESHVLSRDATMAFTAHHPSILASMLDPSAPFSKMSSDIEFSPHSTIHASIAGRNGDFKTMYSPNDPVFWLHHAFVDKLWFYWQSLRQENVRKFDGAAYSQPIDARWTLNWNVRVADILNSDNVCVDYQDPTQRARNLSTDFRANITNISVPTKPSEEFLNMTGINSTVVDRIQNRTQNLTQIVNEKLAQGLPIPKLRSINTNRNSDAVKLASATVAGLLSVAFYLL